jgi:hypothetical protein
MVSYSGGDSFALGGDLNVSKLVSFYCLNNDFKFTQGAM